MNGAKPEIRPAQTGEEIRQVGLLFADYGRSLGDHLCTAALEQEIASLPGSYRGALGGLWLAFEGTRPLGCVALRPTDAGPPELGRLFVLPAARGRGLGRALLRAALSAAQAGGAEAVVLSTMPEFAEAIRLYRSEGFEPVGERLPGEPIPMVRTF